MKLVYHQKWSRFINKGGEEEKTIGEALLSKLCFVRRGWHKSDKDNFSKTFKLPSFGGGAPSLYNIGSCKTTTTTTAGFDLGKEDEEVVEEEMPPLT